MQKLQDPIERFRQTRHDAAIAVQFFDEELCKHFLGIDEINKEFMQQQQQLYDVDKDVVSTHVHVHVRDIVPIVLWDELQTHIINIEDLAYKYGRSVPRLMKYIQGALGSIGVDENRIFGIYSHFIVTTVLNALDEFNVALLIGPMYDK